VAATQQIRQSFVRIQYYRLVVGKSVHNNFILFFNVKRNTVLAEQLLATLSDCIFNKGSNF
jgi:hypothetical protein